VGNLKLEAIARQRRRAVPCRRGKPHTIALTALATFAGSLSLSPAAAQVMEISSTGVVSVRGGAGAARWHVLEDPRSSEVESFDVELPAAALTRIGQVSVPSRYAAALHWAAGSAGISDALLAALVWQESRWNPAAISNKGAVGLTQLMPQTAHELGVDPIDPYANLLGGAKYLRQLLNSFDGNVEKALAAYNAGPGRVARANGIPPIPETRAYVASIVQRVSSQAMER
jgi:soluble lytic murein transglycosylase-like protein